MSHTHVHRITDNGDVDLSSVRIENSHLGAPSVWRAALKEFSAIDPDQRSPVVYDDAWAELKRITKDPTVPEFVRAVIISTFERMVVRAEELPVFIG